jgi:hypothetical protein
MDELLSLKDGMRKRSAIKKRRGISHQSLRSACFHEHSQNAIRLSSLGAHTRWTKKDFLTPSTSTIVLIIEPRPSSLATDRLLIGFSILE